MKTPFELLGRNDPMDFGPVNSDLLEALPIFSSYIYPLRPISVAHLHGDNLFNLPSEFRMSQDFPYGLFIII
jgi:hypothetical protein